MFLLEPSRIWSTEEKKTKPLINLCSKKLLPECLTLGCISLEPADKVFNWRQCYPAGPKGRNTQGWKLQKVLCFLPAAKSAWEH